MTESDNSRAAALYSSLARRSRIRLWWRRRAKTWASGAAIGAIVVTAFVVAVSLPRLEYHAVSGQVRCMSGKPVVGVWVHDSIPVTGDFAELLPIPGDPSVAVYIYRRVRGPEYSVSVGCGGTSHDWGIGIHSGSVPGTLSDFECFDDLHKPGGGTCRATYVAGSGGRTS